MAILAECPICHKKQSRKNHLCSCGENLINAKRSKRIRYWIAYRVNGKQKRKYASQFIEEAKIKEVRYKKIKTESKMMKEIPIFNNYIITCVSRSNESITYLIQDQETGYIKIGITKNILQRLNKLNQQSINGIKLIGLIFDDIEFELHNKFKNARYKGEWFKPSESLCNFIIETFNNLPIKYIRR